MRCLAFLLILAGLFDGSGCAKRLTSAEEGVHTQTLLIGNNAEPTDLDPHVTSSYSDMRILMALFEGLTAIDEKTSQGVPAAAERWDVSPDGLVYTFYLRPDARWSNGDPLTAEDFRFSFRRILTPVFGSVYSYMLWPIKNAEAFNKGTLADFSAVGVEAMDNRTLRIQLEHPTAYLPALAAHNSWMPVHRGTLEKFGALEKRGTPWTRPGNFVSNGPFALEEWSPHARVVVAKNARYWGASRNRLNKIIFFPFEKDEVEEQAYRAGQVHITYQLPMAKIPGYRGQESARLQVVPSLETLYVNMNNGRPPFGDVRVRRALSLSVDRAAIARALFSNTWAPAVAFTPPDCGGYTARPRLTTDAEAARQLLAEAGYPGGRGLPMLPLLVLNNSNMPRIAEALQAMWQRELGVRVAIELSEKQIWLQSQQNKAHTLGLLGWVADFADPVSFLGVFTSDGGNNWTGWANPQFDALLAQAAKTPDPQARFDMFREAEDLLLNEAAVVPLLHRARTYLVHPAVKGWVPAPLGLNRFHLLELKD